MKGGHAARVAALMLSLVALPCWALPIRTVARTGDVAPGGVAGYRFSTSFLGPSINEAGATAFYTWTGALPYPQNPPQTVGIWSEGGGVLHKVVQEFDVAQGIAPTENILEIYSPHFIDSAGDSVFRAQVSAGFQLPNGTFLRSLSAIYSEHAGVHQLVAATWQPLPALLPGVHLASIAQLAAQNKQGEVVFLGVVQDYNFPSDSPMFRRNGLWTNRGGSVSLIAEGMTLLPGSEGSPSVFNAALLNDVGQTAFQLTRSGTQPASSLWTEAGGALQEFARTGGAASGYPAGVSYKTLGPPSLNNAGRLAFRATLSGPGIYATNDGVLYEGLPGAFRNAYREGDAAPGASPGTVFGVLPSQFCLNGLGDLAFQATLAGPEVTAANNSGVWREGPAGLELVARAGDPAPGTPPGVVFSGFSTELYFNNKGQVAFAANVTGPGVSWPYNRGLWATDLAGNLRLIARTGDLFDVDDDPLVKDLRRISDVVLLGGSVGNESGRPSPLNEAGQLAFSLRTGAGSWSAGGVFVANTAVPEPGGCVLVAMAALAWGARRGR